MGKWQKVNLVIAILFLGGTLAFLAFSRPSITGYVSATYSMKDLEVIVLRDQNYFLNFEDNAKLKSVFMSGKVVGDGDVNIFLESQGERYLIFSNEEHDSGLDSITGFVVKETEDSKTIEADFIPEVEDILPDLDVKDTDLYSEEMKAYIELLKEEREERGKKLFIDFIKKTDGYEFNEECIETCALFGLENSNYKFIFKVDKGTTLFVNNVIYSIEK
ncbi:hypothetical protein KY342_07035 [Candidatus Woesearchaeota archaeon]|nr:hypothetical protein [Candidatus Woesearchaeota archaeon]